MTNTELFPPLDSFELVPDFPELAVPDANGIKVTEQPLDWDGPDDKDDPHNWPIWKKVFHSAIPAIYSFGLTTGISTSVAALPFIMRQFQVTREVALLSITLYTLGIIFGPLLCSPFSELYGRRMIYWTNFPMLVTFNAIAAASDSFAVLLAFRFLAGAGGSGVLAVGAGTISDLWDSKDAGRVGLSYILAPFLGPTLGPLIGAYVIGQYDNDWKYAIWVLLMILAPVGLAIILMQETSKSRILYLRARRRGSYLDPQSKRAVMQKLGKAMLKPLHMCLFEVSFFQPCSN
ncbi:MAG: hypothetical protein HETSPECPRED_004566 [Heterodermia speciosa]|uniref:Major facilitator superfamily (MFS) profile domain-containing protein n=1 Tax=Heterodermia speciosa TaxID=116794 RepID=A0A8H3FDC9_9LECA|nr:MAG: hypothetical protein HETSPECPRED_004566 [Heterodermia speciosa]